MKIEEFILPKVYSYIRLMFPFQYIHNSVTMIQYCPLQPGAEY